MKPRFAALIMSVTMGLFLSPSQAAHAQAKPAATEVDGNIKWVFDYEAGKQLSAETGKPLFVVFRCER